MPKFVKYNHHNSDRYVREDLIGKHKEYCLCYSCEKFKPNTAENCDIAGSLHAFDVRNNVRALIWDCPEFEEVAN